MSIPASRVHFDFDPGFLRWAQDAAREMEAIRTMGGFTAFERTQIQLRQAAEAMRLKQEHIADLLSPAVLQIAADHQRMMKLIHEHAVPAEDVNKFESAP